jgi:diacylglycerol kinase family enzyme
MLKPKTYLIFNPFSAWGKTRLRYKEILSAFQKIFGCDFVLLETVKPLEAITLSRIAIKDNAELIVCVGGDGTINEVVNGFYSDCELINTNCRLGIISSGTGQGFAQSMGIPENFEEQVLRIKHGTSLKIDVGKATFNNMEGRVEHRFFVNELQVGIGGAVVKNAETKSKLLGGLFAFGYTTIKTSFSHPNQKIKLSVNGKKEITKSIVGIVFANGQYTGGGMNLVPSAKPFDGRLDIMIMHELVVNLNGHEIEVQHDIYLKIHLE